MKGLNNRFLGAQLLAVTLLMSGTVALGQGRLPSDGTTGAAYAPNPRAVSLYNLGLTAYKQNSPESAIIFFKRACDIDPNLADAQYNLGVIYQLQKRYKEAAPRFEEVLRIKPSDPDAHFQLGIIMQETGRPSEARNHLSCIAPNNPHFPDAQRRLTQLNNPDAVPTATQPDGLRDGSTASNPYAGTAVYGQQLPGQPLQQPVAQQPAYNASQSYGQPAAAYQPPAQPYNAQPTYNSGQPAATTATGVAQQTIAAAGSTFTPVQQTQPPTQPATAYNTGPQTTTTQPSAVAPTPLANVGPVPTQANTSLRIIATGFSAPSGLTFDRNGNLYVANYMSNSIDRIGPDGSRSTFCTGTSIRGPIGLVSDESGNIFVANYNGGTVAKVSPAGISSIIASGFKKPYYLTLDRDGNLYVTQQEDNSIVRISLPRALGSKPTTP